VPATQRDRYVSVIVTEQELEGWLRRLGPDAVLATLDVDKSGGELARFIAHWRERWLCGERVRVLVSLDGARAVAVRDPDAPAPHNPRDQQLTL